jgi:hypothetical protein
MARFIGIWGKDGDCRWTNCRSGQQLKCARQDIATIFVPSDTAPATRAAADIHQRAFGEIENKLGVRGGRRPKRNVGIGLAHRGERRAGTHAKCHGGGEHSDQNAH